MLTVSGLGYATDYTLVAKNVLVSGVATDLGSKTFTTKAISDLWNLVVTPTISTLRADGADNTVVTFKLMNKVTGAVDVNADNVVLDLNTTYGTLASKRITIQDGQATVLFTSEFSNTDLSAKIDAQIIEASGDYKDLIGKVTGTSNVSFTTNGGVTVDAINMISSEANQADRITLFFDKDVSLINFVQTTKLGELKYIYSTGIGTWSAPVIKTDAGLIAAVAADKDVRHALLTDSVVVKQDGVTKTIKGLKPVAGNSKAMEVIFEKIDNALTDNRQVDVETNVINSLLKNTKSTVSFNLTDARVPEATSVTVEGLNTLKVKFSEAMDEAKFNIDGQFVIGTHFTAGFGEFNPITLADTRDLATIKLASTFDEDGDTTTPAGYFLPGSHSIQISSGKDFAARTDVNNIGTTQNLNFSIVADVDAPKASVKVESPEQFRVTFDKLINETQAQVLAGSEFQVYDTTAKKYVSIFTATDHGTKFPGLPVNISDLISVVNVSGTGEYVVELKKDWTAIYNTTDTNKNFYNDKFRIVIAADSVTNSINGTKNAEIVLDLNQSGSALNAPDTTSAKIIAINQIGTSSVFNVMMDEPVKLANLMDNTLSLDNAGSTLGQGQTSLAQTIVQFIGADKDGKVVTINGTVGGYTVGSKGSDAEFTVSANLQTLVDAGYNENWKVVVKSLSDDVGNTVSTETKDFKVSKLTTASPFTLDTVVGKLNANITDTIVLTFSEGVLYRGEAADATNPAQYTLNGKTLPVGTDIKVSDSDATIANGLDTITITLADKTLLETSNMITVNKNLISYDGSVITGATEVQFVVVDKPVAVIPGAPAVSADDNTNVIIDITTAMEYSINGAAYIAYNNVAPDLSGAKTVNVRVKAEGINPAGLDTILTFNKAAGPVAPLGITKTDETAALNDGTLVGTVAGQEYQVNGAGAWTAITGTSVVGLAPGSYVVRVATTPTTLAGASTAPLVIAPN